VDPTDSTTVVCLVGSLALEVGSQPTGRGERSLGLLRTVAGRYRRNAVAIRRGASGPCGDGSLLAVAGRKIGWRGKEEVGVDLGECLLACQPKGATLLRGA
jgi:hypothetical protein